MEDKVELTTLIGVLNHLRKEGYTHDFRVSEEGKLCSTNDEESFTPEDVKIVNFYRFEGETNPEDMSILYVVETNTGLKGSVSNSYGPYADASIEEFMKQVEDRGKNLDKESK